MSFGKTTTYSQTPVDKSDIVYSPISPPISPQVSPPVSPEKNVRKEVDPSPNEPSDSRDVFKHNIVFSLIYKYVLEHQFSFLMIVISIFVINILQTNFITSITSTMIDSIEHNNFEGVYLQYKYFIAISLGFFAVYNFKDFFEIRVISKICPWMKYELFKYITLSNNSEMDQQNIIKYNLPINRSAHSSMLIMTSILSNFISNGAFLIIISGYFLYKNITLGSIFLLSNILLITFIVLNWNNMVYYNKINETQLNENEMNVLDIFNNFDKMIFRGQAKNELNAINEKSDKFIQTNFDMLHNISKYQAIMTVIIYVIIFAALWYLIHLKQTSQITTQVFIAFFTILLLYRDKLSSILQLIPQYIEYSGRVNFILSSFDGMKGEYSENKLQTYKEISLPFDDIRFENVSYKYNTSDNYLFENLNIHIQTNQKIIGITGTSGKGKSTIMKLLLKLHDYSNGNIYIDGVNIRDIDPMYIRDNITYVNQSAKLFNMSIVDNIMYGCKDSAICKNHLDIILKSPAIQKLYKNIDLAGKPAGMLGESLSGGQRQIVNILSGLVNPSKILILDEPTNALDINLKTELLEIIDAFRKYKKCIIIITHDRDVYPLFDERIQL